MKETYSIIKELERTEKKEVNIVKKRAREHRIKEVDITLFLFRNGFYGNQHAANIRFSWGKEKF